MTAPIRRHCLAGTGSHCRRCHCIIALAIASLRLPHCLRQQKASAARDHLTVLDKVPNIVTVASTWKMPNSKIQDPPTARVRFGERISAATQLYRTVAILPERPHAKGAFTNKSHYEREIYPIKVFVQRINRRTISLGAWVKKAWATIGADELLALEGDACKMHTVIDAHVICDRFPGGSFFPVCTPASRGVRNRAVMGRTAKREDRHYNHRHY
jgi:hypothetical protein